MHVGVAVLTWLVRSERGHFGSLTGGEKQVCSKRPSIRPHALRTTRRVLGGSY